MTQRILFYPGPLHHFFFIPVTILWKLLKQNNVILVLDENYRNDPKFSKISNLDGIEEIIFIKEKNSIRNYFELKKQFKNTLLTYKFSQVYIHNPSYVPSYALAYLSKVYQPDAKRIYFQLAREVTSYEMEAKVKLNILIDKVDIPYMPYPLKKFFMIIFTSVKYLLVFKLLPLISFATFFHPWVNPYYPKKSFTYNFKKAGFMSGDQDNTIFFDDKTIHNLLDFFQGANFILEKLPLEEAHEEIYSYFFNSRPKKEKIIAIFPTWGNFHEDLSETWLEVIQLFKKNYPEHKIQLKFHPGVIDKNIENMFRGINNEIQDIKILNRNTPAFKIVVDSDIILGDTSTVLWFASGFQDKTVFSLDLFDLDDGGCLELYSDKLNYINNIKKLNLYQDNNLENL